MKEIIISNYFPGNTMNDFEALENMIIQYTDLKSGLPWLDMAVYECNNTPFENFAHPHTEDYINAVELSLNSNIQPGLLKRYNPVNGSLEDFESHFQKMAEHSVPLIIYHTDLSFAEISTFAGSHPYLNVIIESGPRKILYFIDDIKAILSEYSNVYLCTYNFCNWYGIEELCKIGFSKRLLYGSGAPVYSSDVAMGPLIFSELNWKTRCDIAGNNLRQLLQIPPVYPSEIHYQRVPPFIIDVHSHNVRPHSNKVSGFHTPDENFSVIEWIDYMNLCSIEQSFLNPMESIFDPAENAEELTGELRSEATGRFRFFVPFHPGKDDGHLSSFKKQLEHPDCVGIKIHPTVHETPADDDVYETVWELAAELNKPIMTHSWEISDYNPVQKYSFPDRFRRWLEIYPQVNLCLGHAGGRANAFRVVTQLCSEFSNIFVDISGDYFDNGMIEAIVAAIGTDRVLFGTDVNWFDSRCMLGAVIGANLSIEDKLKILRYNALKWYNLC